ncbi:MAG: hypothetical protein IJU40_07290 [Desulfovibrionaceae bacterium]|nr:hypothetical protein [Desulfovibrionaceae bacterium]
MPNLGLQMLDQALEIAKLEQRAMEAEDYEDAIGLSIQRGKITNEAWDFFQNDFKEEYREKLLQLQAIHKTLKSLALKAHAEVSASMFRSQQEKKRMRGYQVAVAHALQ